MASTFCPQTNLLSTIAPFLCLGTDPISDFKRSQQELLCSQVTSSTLQVTDQGAVPDSNQAYQNPSLGFFKNWN